MFFFLLLFCRLYVKYLRSIAEKTDFGRLAGPSVLRLVDEAMNSSGGSSFNGKLTSEVWDSLERVLEVLEFLIPHRQLSMKIGY